MCWHAYEYGWRRVALHTRGDHSPIDPERQWFDPKLAGWAEEFWSKKLHRSKPAVESWRMRVAAAYRWAYANGQPMPPGVSETDPRVKGLVARFEQVREEEFGAQDRERAAARARIIGDGKNPDGSHSAETLAYVALCCRQIQANMRGLFGRSQWMKQAPDGSPMPNADSAKDNLSEDELAKLRKDSASRRPSQKKGFE
jgi:hypothetical protein